MCVCVCVCVCVCLLEEIQPYLPFIDDKNKGRIIKACSLGNRSTLPQRLIFFFKISQSIRKIVLKEFKFHSKDYLPFL